MSEGRSIDWDSELATYRRNNNGRVPGAEEQKTAAAQGGAIRPVPVLYDSEYDGNDAVSEDEESEEDNEDENKQGSDSAADEPPRSEEEISAWNAAWSEYRSAADSAKIIFFNSKLNEVSVGKVPPLPPLFKRRASDDDLLEEPPVVTVRAFERTRKNSMILQETFDDSKVPRFDRSGKSMAEDDEEEAIPVKHKTATDRIRESLEHMQKNSEYILSLGASLSPHISETLHEMRKSILKLQGSLQDNCEMLVDERNHVDSLVDRPKLKWTYSKEAADYYLAATKKMSYKTLQYTNWHFPEYFSDLPLPAGCTTANCIINLPPFENALMSSTRVPIFVSDPVSKAIAAAFTKCRGHPELGQQTDYVLRAKTQREYMSGENILFSYAYVRKCLRDGVELELILVKRPEPEAEDPKEREMEITYQSHIPADLEALSKEDYRNMSVRGPWSEIKSLPMSAVNFPFRGRVIGIENFNAETFPRLGDKEDVSQVFLRCFVFHGVTKVFEFTELPLVDVADELRWNHVLQNDTTPNILINNIPRESKIGFILVGKNPAEKDKEMWLGWVALQLVDVKGHFLQGAREYRMWPFPSREGKKHGKKRDVDPNFIFRATNVDNASVENGEHSTGTLSVQFDSFAYPITAPLVEKYSEPNPKVVGVEVPKKTITKAQMKHFEMLQLADPLYILTPEDKQLLWLLRHHLVEYPGILPKFLQCVQWGKQEQKNEAHRLLGLWAPPVMLITALELLDGKYADFTVREYAVNVLRRLTDEELQLFLLQFVQCLKYEPYYDSPLCRFLIERALANPYEIGHALYWHLKAELHNPFNCERFTLILEEYLSHCGRYALELRKQTDAVLKMQKVAEMVVHLKRDMGFEDSEAMKQYTKECEKLNRDFFEPMGKFQIPFNPKLEATTLVIEKCRYMSSKMVPLWLVFKNAADDEAPNIYLIFKSGDDLRQDILTLQLLRVMDKLWLANGLDMRMKPYACIATGVNDDGEGVGMIEVVMNSDTTSGIQLKYGGGAMGALKNDPIDLFIREHNKGKALYEKAVENFIRSCAGYCVATFVLGIGDRHNGNIMVTKNGHLFHIDFGHFLGNFKKKFGVNRERAAFVFTQEMAFVMGGKNFNDSPLFIKFTGLCTKAFNVLRQNAALLENLFVLMVSAGMPELMKESDIYYLKDKLFLDIGEKKADKELQAEIKKSLETTYRRIDNMIHNLRHGN